MKDPYEPKSGLTKHQLNNMTEQGTGQKMSGSQKIKGDPIDGEVKSKYPLSKKMRKEQ